MTTKRKSGRTVLLLGLILIVVLIIVGYVVLSGGGGGLGGLSLTPPSPTAIPTMSVLVPKEDIDAGRYISETLLETTFEISTVERVGVAAEADVIVSRSQIQGMVAKDVLPKGEIMRLKQFVAAGLSFRIPPGKRAFPVEVDRYSGVVGRIAEKDRVDVILSGIIEEYLPVEFPLCQPCQLPGACPQNICKEFPQTNIEPFRLLSVKTLIQNVEVLEVITLTVEPPKNVTPTPGPAGLPSGWILILAVDPEQAEVLKFAKDQGMSTQLLLRRRGDESTVETRGITTWILIDTYKMPSPRLVPYEFERLKGSFPSGVIP